MFQRQTCRPRPKYEILKRRFHSDNASGKCFSVHTTPIILDLCFMKTRAGKSRDYGDVIVSVFKMFSSILKHKAGVFKFLRFKERFRETLFS